MPLAEWQDTKQTLHRFCQVVGELRLAASLRRNHWWNAPLHSPAAAPPPAMGQADANPTLCIDPFVDHHLRVHTLDGQAAAVPRQGRSVAPSTPDPSGPGRPPGGSPWRSPTHPFDPPDADRPFAAAEHAGHDPAWARRYWQVRSQVNLVLEEFAAGCSGKASPVHHFWHTFGLATPACRPPHRPATNGRPGDPGGVLAGGGQLRVLFGDDRFSEPAFSAYATPNLPGWPRRRCNRTPPPGGRSAAAGWPCCRTGRSAPSTIPRTRYSPSC